VSSRPGLSPSLIDQADAAMARGDVRQAASLLELAAQRGRDSTTLLRLATVRRSLGDIAGATRAAEAGVDLSPRNFLMSLLLGSLREAASAYHAAERAYRFACACAPPDMALQPRIEQQLAHARSRVAMAKEWRQALLEWHPSGDLLALTPSEERRIRHFRTNVLENLDADQLVPPVFIVPGLRDKRYFEAGSFAGVDLLERDTDEIRNEFHALVEHCWGDFAVRLAGLRHAEHDAGRVGSWSMIPLVRNGRVVEEFASRCPRTMAVTRELDQPELGLISPSLYFSVLEPNSRIAPHTGITNARVILHLPLIVPDDCGFRVGGETRSWEEGRAMVFDDMTTHEAWNDSDRMRVVLIADLWRPELSKRERGAIAELMRYPESPEDRELASAR